jgi:GH24 family phage-related lysozyme (muramidase)
LRAIEIDTMNAAKPSSACLALVKRFEGFRAEPTALGDDRWLVGYGHVRHGAPPSAVGESEAEFLLKEDLEEVAQVLRARVLVDLSQPQFDALASFGFSIGREALETSDVVRHLNAGDTLAAAAALDRWVASDAAAGDVVAPLVRRRAAEKALFLGEDAAHPAPSALLRPVRVEPAEEEAPAPLGPGPAGRAAETQSDMLGLAALGLLGLLLITMGVTGADEDKGLSYLVFAGPGAVAVAMSVYYLLKKSVELV